MSERFFYATGQQEIFTGELRDGHPSLYVVHALGERYGIRTRPSSQRRSFFTVEISEEGHGIFNDVMQTDELRMLTQLLRLGEMPDLSAYDGNVKRQLKAIRYGYVARAYDRQASLRAYIGEHHLAQQYKLASIRALRDKKEVLGDVPELDIPEFVGHVVERVISERQQSHPLLHEDIAS